MSILHGRGYIGVVMIAVLLVLVLTIVGNFVNFDSEHFKKERITAYLLIGLFVFQVIGLVFGTILRAHKCDKEEEMRKKEEM